MNRAGYTAVVCRGWVEAARAIAAYLGREDMAPDAGREAVLEVDAMVVTA